jgi:hypothetical protein
MTVSPGPFLVEFQAPGRAVGRSPSSVVSFRLTSSATLQIGLPMRPKTSPFPSRLPLRPRAALSVPGKTPFNTQ